MFERSKARFSLRLFLASALVAVGLFGTGAARAQTTPTPTAAQMEVFKNLPPEDFPLNTMVLNARKAS